jgi:hypothetical protein
METQERPRTVTSRSQLRALADAATAEVIDYLVEKFDGDNYSLLKTRPDIWPPIDTAKSEPLTRLVAAFELEHAAHAAQRNFIRYARENGRSWYEIGQALDLLWQAVVSKDSVADEAYDYALRYDRITAAKPSYTWTCQVCRQVITDHGPWPQLPKQEEGHASDCSRWNHQVEAWRRDNCDQVPSESSLMVAKARGLSRRQSARPWPTRPRPPAASARP